MDFCVSEDMGYSANWIDYCQSLKWERKKYLPHLNHCYLGVCTSSLNQISLISFNFMYASCSQWSVLSCKASGVQATKHCLPWRSLEVGSFRVCSLAQHHQDKKIVLCGSLSLLPLLTIWLLQLLLTHQHPKWKGNLFFISQENLSHKHISPFPLIPYHKSLVWSLSRGSGISKNWCRLCLLVP